MKRSYPHYHLVPKDLEENLLWRAEVVREAQKDPMFAAAIVKMCSEDALFYINGFCWTQDPRDTAMPLKPFITYSEFQDDAIDQFLDAVERGYDMAWPKSRTMGASWMGLTCIEWMWHFQSNLSFLLVSRNQDYVDQKGNPKSLFHKIRTLHKYQPKWLLPTGRALGDKDQNSRLLHLENADTGSVIDGESTTGDAGRGDRRTAMFIDEFAAFEIAEGFKVLKSSRDTTKCRLFNSTPQGSANAFYDVVHKTVAKVVYMHWSTHPIYKQGLYTSEKDESGTYRLKIVDTEFTGMVTAQRREWEEPKDLIFPEQYPFILDGETRSPWFDSEEARCASPQEVAQELNIDFLGSDYQFFDPAFIRLLVAEYCVPPTVQGRLLFDEYDLKPRGVTLDQKGPFHLWFNQRGSGTVMNDRESIAGRKFGVGADVAHGTGASNSVASVVDLTSGKKVAVWRDAHTAPEAFADLCIALCKWFNDAHLIWDASGSGGRRFTQRVLDQRYNNIYYRKSEQRVRARISDQPGYYMNAEDRAVLLGDYKTKLLEREFINQSEPGLSECLEFIVQPGGKVEHSKAANAQNPTDAREAHGDEVIADALASRCLAMRRVEPKAQQKKAPYMSPAWRFEQEKLALAAAEEGADW